MASESILDKLNPPQREAVLYRGGPLLIHAGAGTGKTRVITHRIASLIEEGVPAGRLLAVTFTNKAAQEMQRRVDTLVSGQGRQVWLHTFHALACRLMRQHAGALKLTPHFTIFDEDDQKKVVVEALKELGLEDQKTRAALYVALISRAKDDLLDAGSYAIHTMTSGDPFRETVARVYERYQKKLTQAGALDFGDLLLRAVELLRGHPSITEYYQKYFLHLLVDEYQDTNHAQYILTKILSAAHKNLCVVGDPDQCLPPGTRVMTPRGPKAIEELRQGDEIVSGSGWGRACPARIEKVMMKPYRGDLLLIRLRTGKILKATPNHVCFARLDPVPGMHYVYLMWRKGKGYRIGTTSGVRSSKDGSLLNGIMVRTNQEVADAIWILHACRSLGEARYFEQLYSVRYGIPTMVFHVRGRRMAVGQEWVDRLFLDLDTEMGAQSLMRDLRLDRDFPHHRPYAVTRGEFHRKYVWFTMFGDARSYEGRPWHDHRIQLVTSDAALRLKVEGRFPIRGGNRGTWRIETARKDYDEGLALSRSICSLDGMEVMSRARLTSSKPFSFMPASHLRPGMAVPILEGDKVVEDRVESVETVPFEGQVYDLSVPDMRNYVAEGMLVHNSIYGWRGADIRNIMEFERDFPGAKVVTLEQNYRSTRSILGAADRVVENNRTRKPKTLWTERTAGEPVTVFEAGSETEEARWAIRRIMESVEQGLSLSEVAIFYRTNAQSRSFEEACRAYQVPCRVVGAMRFYERKEIKDAIAYARILVNPADSVSLSRILNAPARGIGKTSQEAIEKFARFRGLTLLEALNAPEVQGHLSPGARRGVAGLLSLLKEVNGRRETTSASRLMTELLGSSGYIAALEEEAETDPDAAARLGNLQELVNAMREHEDLAREEGRAATLEGYLESVALQSAADTYDPDAPSVTLMTVHLAKGLEFPVVFLTGLEEGLFPIGAANSSPEDLEEERRLCYVGMTRAKDRLHLTYAATRRIYGEAYRNLPSRFIFEAGLNASIPSRSAEPGNPEQRAPGVRGVVRIGQRVRHPDFGDGRVMERSGSGEMMKLTVQFDSGMVKKLLLRYAALELL